MKHSMSAGHTPVVTLDSLVGFGGVVNGTVVVTIRHYTQVMSQFVEPFHVTESCEVYIKHLRIT